MKKAVLLIALMIGCTGVFAQKIDKNELKQLQAFLSQPGERDATNAQALNISDTKSPATWEGVTVENGHVTKIEWKDKHLAGALDLSGFDALQEVNISRNNLTGLVVNANPALTALDASRNKLTSFSSDNCPALTELKIYRNRLTDIDLSGTTALKTLNCSNNLLV